MPRGGARPGAGRKPGVPGKPRESSATRSQEAAKRILAEGTTPLDYLVGVMRGDQVFEPERFEAAKAAAPYVHARLAAIEHKGEVAVRNVARLPEPVRTAEEWARKQSLPLMQ